MALETSGAGSSTAEPPTGGASPPRDAGGARKQVKHWRRKVPVRRPGVPAAGVEAIGRPRPRPPRRGGHVATASWRPQLRVSNEIKFVGPRIFLRRGRRSEPSKGQSSASPPA
eukprot:8165633-Pyramimonas_sp.AAC.1